jgi:vacuolar-type H+-ATPase subunit I/STV1
MKHTLSYCLLLLLPLFFACGSGSENAVNPVEDSLKNINQNLSGQVVAKDSAIFGFIRSFNEIQENLDVIKDKEKLLTTSSQTGELDQNQKDKIIGDIQAIYDLMVKNKQKLSSVNKKLKKANLKISEFEKMIERMNNQIAEKDVEISELKSQLEKMNVELSEVTLNYEAAQEMLEEKTGKLNTGFYAFGTAKELIKQGVLTKEGGFIGMGKAEKLKADFNKSYFTKIDVSETSSIPLACKKAKLITVHPSDSYKFDGPEGKIEKLVITNPEEFWSASKYLVIVVE